MANPSSVKQLKQAETDIAVLQVRFTNLDEKIDGVKSDLCDIKDDMCKQSENSNSLMKKHQEDTLKAFEGLTSKISSLEKWRWMLMGAGVAVGALGLDTVMKLLHA